MLRDMSWDDFLGWMAYTETEPLEQDIYQLAHIAQVLVNLHRDPKRYPQGFPLEDFVLKFKDEEKVPQTAEYIERVFTDFFLAHNASLKEKGTQ